MSHLSTIIERVNHREQVYKDDKKGLYEDSLFEQSVINLMEYNEAWQDQTPHEVITAMKLYDKHRPMLKGKGMSSHAQRLIEADKIRKTLHVGIMSTTWKQDSNTGEPK